MAKDTDSRRQVDREARGDRAAPQDHLPPGSDPATGASSPATGASPEAVPPHDDPATDPAQRTHGEAWDAVRPHNDGQARQGPR